MIQWKNLALENLIAIIMDRHYMLFFVIAAAICFASGTLVLPTETNPTMKQLFQAMSRMMVENNNLKTQMQGLKGEVSRLTAALDQSQEERFKFENSSLICEEYFNKTIIGIQSEYHKAKTTMLNDLGHCEATKKSLEKDKIIHHHVLNASKSAYDDCLGQLVNSKAKLGQCLQKSGPIFPRTCQEWKDGGYTENGDYIVDPDGPGGVNRFQVECEMNSHRGVPVMIMHHDSEARMDAGPNNLETPYSNIRNVAYKASIPQITAVVTISSKCEQYIKYECSGSHISNFATWYSRDGTPMYYWGGAQPGSRKCACGMTNSCNKPGVVCNCDINDLHWRSDSGVLTDKNTLPVTKMAFGDLELQEAGYHRLGALRCY